MRNLLGRNDRGRHTCWDMWLRRYSEHIAVDRRCYGDRIAESASDLITSIVVTLQMDLRLRRFESVMEQAQGRPLLLR